MISYFDSSALVAVYVSQSSSKRARREVRAARTVPFTPLHELEIHNALRLLHGRGELTATEAQRLADHVGEDLEKGRLEVLAVDLGRSFQRARRLSDDHAAEILCRSLDVLHVALALEIGCKRLVSGDDRQLSLARKAGLDAVDIKRASGSSRVALRG